MGVALESVRRDAPETELRVIESVDVTRGTKTHKLAVCERGSTLLLARERERGTLGDDGKRSRENGVETFYKPTSDIADIADAIALGLLT